jgi:hypothetical protein
MSLADTKMMRIPTSLHDRLACRAEAAHTTLSGALGQAIDALEDAEFWAEVDHTMTRPDAIVATAAELDVWQRTNSDGLDGDEEFDWQGLA